MVMALYAIAELIEARAVERARDAIKSLLDLSPQEAEVLQDDGEWRVMLAKEVAVGTVVRVRPGERLALDGMVRNGRSAVDQSPVTGESMPVEKGPGDEVFAGTINQDAALEFEVTAPATDTVLARIIHTVEAAEGSRDPPSASLTGLPRSTPLRSSCWRWASRWRGRCCSVGRG